MRLTLAAKPARAPQLLPEVKPLPLRQLEILAPADNEHRYSLPVVVAFCCFMLPFVAFCCLLLLFFAFEICKPGFTQTC